MDGNTKLTGLENVGRIATGIVCVSDTRREYVLTNTNTPADMVAWDVMGGRYHDMFGCANLCNIDPTLLNQFQLQALRIIQQEQGGITDQRILELLN